MAGEQHEEGEIVEEQQKTEGPPKKKKKKAEKDKTDLAAESVAAAARAYAAQQASGAHPAKPAPAPAHAPAPAAAQAAPAWDAAAQAAYAQQYAAHYQQPAAAAHESSAPVKMEEAPPVTEPRISEEERLWGIVRQNSSDFTAWTQLLGQVEKEPVDIHRVRKAYDEFLVLYPLCYGYFKKYADLVRRESDANAREVYERGVASVPHSVEMWVNFISFTQETGDTVALRDVFRRALLVCGSDLRDGHTLWDKAIEFEKHNEEWAHVNELYGRIMQVPLVTLDGYFERYKHFVFSHPLDQVVSAEVAAELEEEAAAAAGDEADERSAEAQEGDRKALLIRKREATFKATQAAVDQRKPFESAITRPYFHVKALDEGQLDNWRQYLDFAEQSASAEETEKLYERCLVAGALYSEFWERYAAWVAGVKGSDAARAVYHRACAVFLKSRPSIHLSHALFEETEGAHDAAREIYTRLIAGTPGLLQAVVQYANFERRRGSLDRVAEIYEAGIAAASPKVGAFLATQRAEFLAYVVGDKNKAREAYATATASFPGDRTLWLARIDFESRWLGSDIETRVQALFDQATDPSSAFSDADRADFLLRNTQFVSDRGQDVKRLLTLKTQYRKMQKKTRKRKADDSEARPAKAARAAEPAAAAPAPAPAAAAYGHAYGAYAYAPAPAAYWPAQ